MATIYLIDDDPDVTEAGKLVLEKAGHQVSAWNQAAEGIKAIQAAAPDLLVLDIMMQNLDDGIVMARQLKKDGCKFPILMLTSVGRVTGLNFGADSEMLPVEAFIEKPVKPAVLIEQVEKLLKGGVKCS